MTIKNFKSLIIILISIFLCSELHAKNTKYKIYWHDLREIKTKETIELEFTNDFLSGCKKRKLRTGRTKNIWLPELDGLSIPYSSRTVHGPEYAMQFLINEEERTIEFFLLNYQVVTVEDYKATIRKLDSAIGYILAFPDKTENRWCYLYSTNNTFSIEKENISKEPNFDIISIWNQMQTSNVGFYAGQLLGGQNSSRVYYLVKSLIYDGYAEVGAQDLIYVYYVYKKEVFENELN